MKSVVCALYGAFPAVLLLAQTSISQRPADALPNPGMPSLQQLRFLPKRFPPEMTALPPATAAKKIKLSRSYCVYPNADRKSLSFKRCEPVPARLVVPLGFAAPKQNPVR